MLINEIIVNELKYDPSQVANTKLKGVTYKWDSNGNTFSNIKTGKEVPPNSLLHIQLIKANPKATGKATGGLIKRGISAVGKATGLTGVGQDVRDNPKAGILQKTFGIGGAMIGRGIDAFRGRKQQGATSGATPQATPNDTSDDQENLDLLVKHNYISQADADEIQNIAITKKITLDAAYQLWQEKGNPSANPSTPAPAPAPSPSPILDPSGNPFQA